MNLVDYTVRHRSVSWMVIVLLIGGGILSFLGLGRLEDPAFTIKQALINTQYPGASPQEVEEEVTLVLEDAIQRLPYVDHIESTSSAGLSQIKVEMKSIYRKDDLAQIWDEMRRKINDNAMYLPPGAESPMVIDDFSDVYGIFLAVTGEGFDYQQLADYTDFLKRELVLVPGVGKVTAGGERSEQIQLEIDRAKLAASGFSVAALQQVLSNHNLVNDAGKIQVGSEYIRISPKASENSAVSGLSSILLGQANGELVYLTDIAKIKKNYVDPPTHLYRFNGDSALTLNISFANNVNVVEVGKAVNTRMAELEYARPVGVELNYIYNQPQRVEESVNNFLISLGQAVAIVVIVLLLSMGLRPGILMSGVLLLTILGTFIVMRIMDIELHRISLGALIIALGMLVDNAIVITEGVLIGMQRGLSRLAAAKQIVSNTSWPLLGATVIAITAFAPIGLSPDASGEFTNSLFWVLLISLFLSWILAITITPFFCYLLFRDQVANGKQAEPNDPYRGIVYRVFRHMLRFTLRFRVLTMLCMLAILATSLWGFKFVKQGFFPTTSLPIVLVDYWLPEGTDIRATERDIEQLEQRILSLDNVAKVTSTIGQGAERFMLTYNPERNFANYAQLILETHSYEQIKPTLNTITDILNDEFPQAFTKFTRISIGPSTKAKIEARLKGADPDVLRELALKVTEVFNAEPEAVTVDQDWHNRTKVLRPIYDEAEGRRLGVSEADLSDALKIHVNGLRIGVFRDGSELLPIVLQAPESERNGVESLQNIQVYSSTQGAYVSIGQLVKFIDIDWEDPLIKRRDRKRTLAVLADPNPETGITATDLFAKLRDKVEAIELPHGYELEWGGEYESQQKANKAVFTPFPLGILVMFVITVFMFNSIKQTLAIWLTVPLAIIGVTFGLIVMGAPFSFTALLAILSLVGMQIKNGIVLVEEIKRLQEVESYGWLEAIEEAAVSRVRPVTMAAITTILGMIPLLADVFFEPMAVTIMYGLGFATVLTLFVVPVLFALFYRVKA
ncbi:efflux RND transporter permease subunit [Neptunomonas phycophila]|jgi:multidrug efflux pump subunit AcrB|uniref:efflux RND transporter permease subunit n=2 Tax=Neptunomonas phycophila TaxID=1572645 RepID=UPI0026E11A1C|nr:efflux RND transporter permease subunit [Neptunomonas phycophila]MDO6467740.1 efflux RND transporter permease subunit [Neptunomonas phycophila]